MTYLQIAGSRLMKQSPAVKAGCAMFIFSVGCVLFAEPPQLPPHYPKAQYDESKVPAYTLPDPLVMLDGKKVTDTNAWRRERRPEILRLFETNVYGRTMAGRPKEMTWEVTSPATNATNGAVINKTVTIYFAGKKDGPKMDLHITMPANAKKPVPVFMLAGGFGQPNAEIYKRGYGTVSVRIDQVQADRANQYTNSIRAFFAPPGQIEPGPDEWGAIGAWAWAMSRAMDYLETDPAIDAGKVCLNGVSRYGKVVMWAGAQDERFAIVFSGEAGCAGQTIVRRQFGETVKSITGFAPYWFAGIFKNYADRVNDLPVDWHELVALMAPRPVYIATAEQDYWGDPRGSFLAARAAGPVYQLFGETGLGVEDWPPVETPVGDFIGYHNRKGTHGQNEYDWEQFLNFADRHFGFARSNANGSGAFATGQYRNLFVEAGHTPEETTNRINAAFQQLFHGDPGTQAVYFPAGTNVNGALAYVMDIAHNDVRTEGMSYGMMIAVQLNKQAEFDAIWNWTKTYMYHDSPAHPSYGFFSWCMKTNANVNDEMVAPDGEEYFVMALYFAANRWGSRTGIYNYQAEADQLLTNLRHRALITGQLITRPARTNPVTAGPLFNPEHKMVRFSPGNTNPDHTDPSYHLPAFYELWARWGPAADRPFWMEAAAASRDFFPRTTHPVTALAPDYANFDGTPRGHSWNPGAVNFRFDAWRTAMNWSVDWAWWAKDVQERQLSDRLQAFFEAKGFSTHGNQFTLDGNQLQSEHSTGLVAMNAVASLAATNPRTKQYVEALWDAEVPSGQYRYYDGLLYLMGLLHCSGEFRIWSPE
jgi:oligosaccharide reducing-end xylanase